jgi:glycosyltransferase involved in cell wall biosynthesis
MSGWLLVITTSYPRRVAGAEAAGSFVADLVEQLAERMPVRVVAPGERATIETVSPRLTIYRFAAPFKNLSDLRLAHPLDALRIIHVLIQGLRAARAASRDGAVVHTLACWALPSGWWAWQLQRRRRIPYSVWMLGSDVWSLGRIPVVRQVLRRVMQRAQRRYADGMQLAGDSREICGRDVEFLPSTRAMHTRHAPTPAEQPPYRLAFIGRWHPNKGVDLLLEALTLLGEADWQRIAQVRIFGGGSLQDLVADRYQKLVTAGRPVLLGGYLAKDAAEREITWADYVLIPSRIESIPVIFSDAVKLGRPVVAMPVGDFPALFGQAACGVLARQVTASAFRDALCVALRTPPSAFGAAIETHAARFDLARIAERLIAEVAGDVR